MAKKQIEIKAKLNTSDFDTSVTKLQQKLKSLQTDAGMPGSVQNTRNLAAKAGMYGGKADGSMDAKVKQTLKELDDFSRKQFEMSEKTLANMKRREEQLKRLKDQEKDVTKGTQAEYDLRQKIAHVEAKRVQNASSYARRSGAFQASRETIESMDPSGALRGKPQPSSAEQFGFGLGSRVAASPGMAAATIVGAIATSAALVRTIVKEVSAQPRETLRAQGIATNALAGSMIGDMANGRTSEWFYYGAERNRASQSAGRELKTTQTMDKVGGVASGAAIVGGLGAALAMASNPLGWGVGLGLAGAGAYNLITNKNARLNVAAGIDEDFFGGGLGYQKALRANQFQDYAKNYRENLDSEMLNDPLKKTVRDRFYQNMGRDLNTQRQLGLSDRGLLGFANRGTSAGFTEDSMIAEAQGILGAGGGTGSARSANFSLGLQRKYDLTNATSLVGRLGSGQSADSTETSIMGLLKRSEQLGFGKDSIQEQRDFLNAAAGFGSANGAVSQTAQAAGFAEFQTYLGKNPTRAEISGALGGAELMSGLTGDLSGPSGTYFAQLLAGNETFANTSAATRAALMNAGGSLNADSPIARQAAREIGGDATAESVAQSVLNMRRQSAGGAVTSSLVERLRSESPNGIISPEGLDEIATRSAALQGPEFARNSQSLTAFARARGSGDQMGNPLLQGDATPGYGEGPGKRLRDREIAGAARAGELLNEEFDKMSGNMGNAADQAAKLNREILVMIETMQNYTKLSDTRTPEQMEAINKKFISPPKMPNAGKTK